jgi:hypothetical protein
MSDSSSSGAPMTSPPKKGVSPARNAVGIIALIAVLAVLYFEYSARSAFTNAMNALNTRIGDEEKTLATVEEAESLLGKKPDGPGVDVKGTDEQMYIQKTYTWPGVIRSYTLVAFYTKESKPSLHHVEPEGQKLVIEPKPPVVPSTAKGGRGGGGGGRGAAKSKTKSATEKTTADSAPSSKTTTDSATPKATTDSATPKTATDSAPPKVNTDVVPAKKPE